jgi:hypothetical protein
MPFPHLFFLPTGTTTLPLNQETRDGDVIRTFFNWKKALSDLSYSIKGLGSLYFLKALI